MYKSLLSLKSNPKYIDNSVIAIFLLICFFISSEINAQSTCGAETPFFTVDLQGDPDSVWFSPNVRRKDLCCDLDPEENPPLRCVEFLLTLDDNAQGIVFDIYSGAIPPGALGFQINCGPPNPFGEVLCLDGPGPHRITFCEPGNNPNVYAITSIPKPEITPPITISDGCSGGLAAYGLDPSTIQWKSVPSNPIWESYLTCPTCDTLQAIYQDGAPDSIIYEVTGSVLGGCENANFSAQTWVYFVNDKVVEILPKEPTICYGGTNATITANAVGGRPPYHYVWSTGETTQSINVGVGTFSVEVFDNTSCPTTTDEVTVTAFLSPIEAEAGPNQVVCADNPNVNLQGIVRQATGGIWSGGNGAFSPNNTDLNAIYTPTLAEITAGSVRLTLTTTGNGSCPGSSDMMTITITPSPTIEAGPEKQICRNNPEVLLSGTVTVATGGLWNGNGTFNPSPNQLTVLYRPTTNEISRDSFFVYLTSTGNGTCNPVKDSVLIRMLPSPIVEAGPDIIVCTVSPTVQLNGVISNASGGRWIGGTQTFNRNILNPKYTASSDEILNGSVLLILESTGNGLCNPERDFMSIIFENPPSVNAGEDLSSCIDNPTVTINATTLNTTSVSWDATGGIFNPNRTSTTITYTPTAQELRDSVANLTIRASGNVLCPTVSDNVSIRYFAPPIVDAGPNIDLCINSDTVYLTASVHNTNGVSWTTNGTGRFETSSLEANTIYIASEDDKLAGSIIFTITSTNNGSCNPAIDQVQVQFLPSPLVNAGNDSTFCTGYNSIQLRATGAPGYWIGNGGSFFANDSSRQTVDYYFSQDEIDNLTTSLIFVSQIDGVCPESKDTVVFTMIPGPTINAGTDVNLCAGTVFTPTAVGNGFNSLLWETNGTGSLTDETLLSATYTPSLNESNLTSNRVITFTVTAFDDLCPEVSDIVLVNYIAPPKVTVGSNQIHCANQTQLSVTSTLQNTTGVIWTTNTQGTFTNSTSLNTQFTTNLEDTIISPYLLIATTTGNTVCPESVDSLEIIFEYEPQISIGNDTVLCTNTNAINLTATSTNSSSVNWSCLNCSGVFSANLFDATYVFSEADKLSTDLRIYANTISNNSCPDAADEIQIDFLEVPEIVSNTDTICSNSGGLVDLVATTINAENVFWYTSGTGVFEPSNVGERVRYRPSSVDITSGNVNIIIEAVSCISVYDTITFTVTPSPIVNAGPDQTICSSDQITLSANVQNATGVEWISNLGGLFTPSSTDENAIFSPSAIQIQNGNAQLLIKSTGNGSCLPVYDTLNIVIVPTPTANTGSDMRICETTNSITISGTVQNATNLKWTSFTNGTFSPNNTSNNVTYTINDSDRNRKQALLYLEGLTTIGCKVKRRDSIIVYLEPKSKLNFNFEEVVCERDAGIALNSRLRPPSSGKWKIINGTGVIGDINSLATSYIFSEEDKSKKTLYFSFESSPTTYCSGDIDTLKVNIFPQPIINMGPDLYFCDSIPEITFDVSVENANSFKWTTNGEGNLTKPDNILKNGYKAISLDTSKTGIFFSLYATNNGSCDAGDFMWMRFIDRPNVEMLGDSGCIGDIYDMQLLVLDHNYRLYPHTFTWYKGNNFLGTVTGTNKFGVTEEGLYKAIYTVGGCSNEDTNFVVFNEKTVPNNKPLYKFCSEDVASIIIDAGPAPYYYWEFNEANTREVSVFEGGIYAVELINEFNCIYKDTIEVIDNCPPRLFVPNIFTPNGDNDNDQFFVTGKHVSFFDLKIISRWGEVVYQTNDRYARWDGYYRNEPVPVGAYNWIITYRGDGDYAKEQFLKGMVSVVR